MGKKEGVKYRHEPAMRVLGSVIFGNGESKRNRRIKVPNVVYL